MLWFTVTLVGVVTSVWSSSSLLFIGLPVGKVGVIFWMTLMVLFCTLGEKRF